MKVILVFFFLYFQTASQGKHVIQFFDLLNSIDGMCKSLEPPFMSLHFASMVPEFLNFFFFFLMVLSNNSLDIDSFFTHIQSDACI